MKTWEVTTQNSCHSWPRRYMALRAFLEYEQCSGFIAERSENPLLLSGEGVNARSRALVTRLDEAERLVEVYGQACKQGTAAQVLNAKTDLRIFFARNLK